jgi:DNA-binding IscR family transcriptional regulator
VIIKAWRGTGGGYTLAKGPDKIPPDLIIRLMDGALAPSPLVSYYFFDNIPT